MLLGLIRTEIDKTYPGDGGASAQDKDAQHTHGIRLERGEMIGSFFEAENRSVDDAHAAKVDIVVFAEVFVECDDDLRVLFAYGVKNKLSCQISVHLIGDGMPCTNDFRPGRIIGFMDGVKIQIPCHEQGIRCDIAGIEALVDVADLLHLTLVSQLVRMISHMEFNAGDDRLCRDPVIGVVSAAARDEGFFLCRSCFQKGKAGGLFFCFPCGKGGVEIIDLAEGPLVAVALDLLLMLAYLAEGKSIAAGRGDEVPVCGKFRAEEGRLVEMIKGIAVVTGDRDGENAPAFPDIGGELQLIDAVEAVRRARGSERDECAVHLDDIGRRTGHF